MGKTVMVLVIPEPKVRKATAKPVRKHKDKTAYSRKAKHKTPEWGSCCVWGAVTGLRFGRILGVSEDMNLLNTVDKKRCHFKFVCY